jgi:hypothetical protein
MSAWTRLWFFALIVVDRLLGTHLAERELARLQRRMAVHQTQASTIRQSVEALNRLLHVAQVELCVLYLRQRYLLRPETWLRFDPTEGPGEEKCLDLLISQLVRHDLATTRTEVAGEQAYVYHLCPDWDAIADLLNDWNEHLDPLTLLWLEEIRSSENGKIHH